MRGVDEILPLADEKAELRALPPTLESANELQARVARGGDHVPQLRVCPEGV